MTNRRFTALPRINNWPLATKLTLGVLVLFIPAIVAIIVLVLAVLQRDITNQVGNNLHTIAESTARRTAEQLEAEVSQLQFLARNRTVIADIENANKTYPPDMSLAREQLAQANAAWEAAEPGNDMILGHQNLASAIELRTFVNTDPNNVELFTTDKYGGLVAITSTPLHFDHSNYVWWHLAHNDGVGFVFISPPEFDQAGGAYTLRIGVPVYRPNSRELVGVLHVRYRLSSIVNDFAEVSVGETGEAVLLADRGLRLDTTSLESVSIAPEEWAPLRFSTRDWQLGQFMSQESLVARAPVVSDSGLTNINYLGWIVIVRQDTAESLAASLAFSRLAILSSAIGLIVIVTFTVLVARALTQPLGELTGVANQAQSGNLEITARVRGRDEIGQLSEAFNAMIGEIRNFTGSLEAKVTERTAQLSAINEITAAVAGSLDLKEVMSKTVNLIRDRLGYYQVSVFLLDERGENAIVRESTGEVGRILKERPHSLAVGSQSIIGYVTANRKPRIALDTAADAVHFKNPLLPNTRSEMALPLMIGEAIFGALDVQSTDANAFDEQDVAVLQNMANQIAIAINNARLFQEAQKRLDEISLLNRHYLTRAWETFAQANPEAVNLQLNGGQVSPAPDLSTRNRPITISAPYLSEDGTLIAIPIVLRDEVIGEFSLGSPVGVERWGAEDLALVEAVVTQVALAVDNARLLEETQAALAESNRLARRERVISDITNKMTLGADVKRILEIAAEELRRATGSSRAVVRLTGQPSQEVA